VALVEEVVDAVRVNPNAAAGSALFGHFGSDLKIASNGLLYIYIYIPTYI
jgi:hypothetical protein